MTEYCESVMSRAGLQAQWAALTKSPGAHAQVSGSHGGHIKTLHSGTPITMPSNPLLWQFMGSPSCHSYSLLLHRKVLLPSLVPNDAANTEGCWALDSAAAAAAKVALPQPLESQP